jgi:hypothetical protein
MKQPISHFYSTSKYSQVLISQLLLIRCKTVFEMIFFTENRQHELSAHVNKLQSTPLIELCYDHSHTCPFYWPRLT